MSEQQEEILGDILPEFLVEADDLLESLNELLLQLDEGVKEQVDQDALACDKELLNEVFRSAHTLKGLSGMFGFTNINQLTHKIENIFDAARSDHLPVTGDIVDVIFRGIDHVSAMVEGLRNGEMDGVDSEAISEEIQGVLEASGTAKPQGGEVDLDGAMAEASAEVAEEAPPADADIDLDAAIAQAAAERAGEADAAADDVDLDAALAQALADRDNAKTEAESLPAGSNESDKSAEESTASSKTVDPFADVEDDENIPANYLGIFIDETESSLDALTELLLDGVDEKVVEHLLVTCHRIKGSAASIGLNRAAMLGHVMEDLLQDLEEQERQPTSEMADALLCCVDAMRSHVNDLKEGSGKDTEFRSAYDQLIASRNCQENSVQSADNESEQPQPEPEVESSEVAELPEATAQINTEIETAEIPPKATLQLDQESLAKLSAAAPTDSQGLAVQIAFRSDLVLVGMKARLIFEKLSQVGNVFYCDPPEEELDEFEELSQMVMGVVTIEPTSEIQNSLSVEGVEQINFVPIASQDGESEIAPPTSAKTDAEIAQSAESKPSPEAPAAAPKAEAKKPAEAKPAEASSAAKTTKAASPTNEAAASKPVETVRVDIDRLDQLMNLAGQLVINKARFSQISASMKRSVGTKSTTNTIDNLMRSVEQLRNGLEQCSEQRSFDENIDTMQSCVRRVHASMELLQNQLVQIDETRVSVNNLFEAVHQLDRVADGIQKGVMDTRMVPVGPLFGRFKRVIRDISHSSDKKIRLDIRGENTELDKRMIDELGDPLIHIVRNSADHGIESPEDRENAGKPVEGVVTLEASHRGNSIVIEIIDDGKGLDTDRIRNKAIEKGVISAADAEKLTDHQVHQLIWEPGLSTAEQITNVSGRGMGMDIVRSKIEEINGVVEMHSTEGEGTKIAIKLPLTLAILPSLLAEIEGEVFALPVESVSEIVSLSPKDLSTVHSLPTATVRGQTISVVYLSSLFNWSHPPKEKADPTPDETILVIVESEGQLLGLVVDCLLGEEDIVIKALAENYQNVEGVAGASILGDGRVSLILDTSAMLAAASGKTELLEVV